MRQGAKYTDDTTIRVGIENQYRVDERDPRNSSLSRTRCRGGIIASFPETRDQLQLVKK